MTRFRSIEGLRGWLAWTVVLSHVVYASGIYIKGLGPFLGRAGIASVWVFIIISGFVITHLVIEKKEPYVNYIFRRFMRIFPLFFLTCVIGYFCFPLGAPVSANVTWGYKEWLGGFAEEYYTQTAYFWPNFWAHLTMLHGTISTNVLPFGAGAFNPPAWSLSLEWQFYLVAPIFVSLARNYKTAIITLISATLLCILYDFQTFGNFSGRSLLIGAAPLFAVGIASRLAYPKLVGSLPSVSMIIALLIGLIPLGWDLAPVLVWGCIYALLIADEVNASPIDNTVLRYSRILLEGPVPTFFGLRSYSIYLCHFPIVVVGCFLLMHALPTAPDMLIFVILLFFVTTFTLGFSCLLYSAVEKPGIRIGKLIDRRTFPNSVLAVAERK